MLDLGKTISYAEAPTKARNTKGDTVAVVIEAVFIAVRATKVAAPWEIETVA